MLKEEIRNFISVPNLLNRLFAAWYWWLLASVVIALDQWSKIAANTALNYDVPNQITWFFNLTLRYNHGAAWSFLADAGGWQRWMFASISSVVSVALVFWISQIHQQKKWLECTALAFILGGAIGNLYDRLAYGYVIDFLEFHYQQNFFPAFNLADSAICLGAGLLILDMMIQKKGEQ